MNSDCFFKIGHMHDTCEDFALAGINDERAFAIMSDGCSGSPRTDFGARFLSLAMEQLLNGGKITEYEIGQLHIVGLSMARMMSTTAGLNDFCLDATLGYVFTDEHFFRTFLCGDGAIAALKKNGEKWATVIEYPSGAPPYLSYSLNEERTRNYLKSTNECPFTIYTYKWDSLQNVSKNVRDERGMNSHAFIFPREEYDLVMVMSDGVSSFQRPVISETARHFELVNPVVIMDELLNVKSYQGDFIKRRYKRILKNLCAKDGWKHLDDISVAAICSDEKCET